MADSAQRWRNKTSGSVTGIAASVGKATQNTSDKVSGVVSDTTSSIGNSAQGIASEAASAAVAAADQVTSGTRQAMGVGTGAVQYAADNAPSIATTVGEGIKTGPRSISAGAMSAASALHSTAQGVLASDLAGIVDALVQGTVKGTATIYDQAMDARFIETGIGGGHHRLFDGGHTISGAFAAGHGASPDDAIIQESLGTMLGLFRDASTPRGLPLATWDQHTFDQVSSTLESSFHIPKGWFNDLNTFTSAELLGGTIGAVAVIFAWNRADTEAFAKLVGGMGMSSALSANPLLLLVTVVALARAFQKARRSGEVSDFVDGLVRGGLIAGATYAAVAIVGVGGGPAGLALLIAVVTGILVNVATKKVSVVKIGQVVAKLATAVAAERKGAIVQTLPAKL